MTLFKKLGLIASTLKSIAQARGMKLEDRAAELLAQLCGDKGR